MTRKTKEQKEAERQERLAAENFTKNQERVEFNQNLPNRLLILLAMVSQNQEYYSFFGKQSETSVQIEIFRTSVQIDVYRSSETWTFNSSGATTYEEYQNMNWQLSDLENDIHEVTEEIRLASERQEKKTALLNRLTTEERELLGV